MQSVNEDFHTRQWHEPYRSTVAFAEFIRPFMPKTKVIDLGAGTEQQPNIFQTNFLMLNFLGYDIKPKGMVSYADMFHLTEYRY